MTVEQLLRVFNDKNEFVFGIDNVMQALAPHCLYEITVDNGNFIVTKWDKSNGIPQPTSEQIRDEYIRHKTLKEVVEYIASLNEGN
jgi:hypothetical protein